jgi:hypothetical protein
LTDNRTDVSVGEGEDYDPVVSADRDLLAISGRRVVREDDNDGTAVAGPFGETGFALRSLAWNARDHLVAAVTGNGRRVFVAPIRGARSSDRVVTVLDGGRDLLRPAYDRFGGLWVVDSTQTGAVVHLLREGRDRIIQVDGVSGRRISAFTVTRDGTTLVATRAGGTNPTVYVSSLVRDAEGRVRRAMPARTLLVNSIGLGPALDVVQNGATTVAVLSRSPSGTDQITYVELDGSPGLQGSAVRSAPDVVPGVLASLVASSDPAVSLRAVTTDRRLFTLTGSDRWVRSSIVEVDAAAYAQ